MSKKLYIETVGCQMNVLDSELVMGRLEPLVCPMPSLFPEDDPPL